MNYINYLNKLLIFNIYFYILNIFYILLKIIVYILSIIILIYYLNQLFLKKIFKLYTIIINLKKIIFIFNLIIF